MRDYRRLTPHAGCGYYSNVRLNPVRRKPVMPLRAVRPQHETRTRILDAAEELFMQHGFGGTSMRMLTARAGVNLAAVIEFVNHPPRYEECLARVQLCSLSADGKRGDAVEPEDGFIEAVVAVRCRHACIRGDIALEDAHTAPGLVSVDVKADAHSPDLDRLGSGVWHVSTCFDGVLAEHGA